MKVQGGRKKNQSKSSLFLLPLGRREGAMEALPVKEWPLLPVPEGPDKLSLNNVINHCTGPLALPHKESKHTNNYTL